MQWLIKVYCIQISSVHICTLKKKAIYRKVYKATVKMSSKYSNRAVRVALLQNQLVIIKWALNYIIMHQRWVAGTYWTVYDARNLFWMLCILIYTSCTFYQTIYPLDINVFWHKPICTSHGRLIGFCHPCKKQNSQHI